jgi:hypothetical protein
VISDEPTAVQTVEEYGLRVDIEENFLDDKSNGFQVESARLRSAKALERLCFVLAMTTLSLVSLGPSVASLSICPSVCNELSGRDVLSILICRPLRGLLLEPARMLLIAR